MDVLGSPGRSRLNFRDQTRQEDNDVRCDIRSGSIRAATFAAMHFWHRNISRQKVYETILEAVQERIETREQQGIPNAVARACHRVRKLRKCLDRLP